MISRYRSVIGLDLGSRKLKAVEVKLTGKKPVITSLGLIDTPPDAINQTGILNPLAVGDAIKRLFTTHEMNAREVIYSLAGQASVTIRMVQVPGTEATAKDQEFLNSEIQRRNPFFEAQIFQRLLLG